MGVLGGRGFWPGDVMCARHGMMQNTKYLLSMRILKLALRKGMCSQE